MDKIPSSIAECAAKCAALSEMYQNLFENHKTIQKMVRGTDF
jgi:hypothetical protein